MSLIKKGRVINVAIVAVSIVFALILGEVMIRYVAPAAMVEDDVLGWKGVPHVGDWDARGFRNELALDRATVVALGDSQTQGNNATTEESWPQAFGTLASTTVYQIAVGGFGPVQESYLTPTALSLHPRLIILAPYLGNDMIDAYSMAYTKSYWSTLKDPEFVLSESFDDAADVRASIVTGLPKDSLMFKIYKTRLWVRKHSRVYELLGNATRDFREQIGVAKTLDERKKIQRDFFDSNPELAYVYDTTPEIKTVLSGVYREETVDLKRERTKEGWRIAQEMYGEIIKKVRGENVKLLVMIIPTKEYVYIRYMEETGQQIPGHLQKYMAKERELRKEMTTYFSRQHVATTDPTDALVRGLKQKQAIYGQTTDGHPLALGYRVIAEDLYEKLKIGIPE